jgi:hypothetical protein
MTFSPFADLSTRFQLPGSTVAQLVPDALAAARDPDKTLLDCPCFYAFDRHSEACRAVWEWAFSCHRERREMPLITLRENARAA